MNDIKRLRLQNQIFRLVATYYQKMSRGQDGQSLLLDTMSIDAADRGQDVLGLPPDRMSVDATPPESTSNNPFAQGTSNDFTRQVKDYCTFTRCELSPDGSFAKIFVSIWGDEKDQERTMKGILRLVPGMRSSIAKNIRMRAIPHLAIVQDRSFEKGDQVARLIP
jgi:ribosome-binding factor A